MIVFSCAACGGFCLRFNGAPPVVCDDCDLPMTEKESLAEACAVFHRIMTLKHCRNAKGGFDA